MNAKSLITSPTFGHKMGTSSLYQISGRGKIDRVEVSADGGKFWAEAELQEPVLPKCITRFRILWQWDGISTIIKSRAIDETGYIQSDRKELVEKRGRQGYFHYNAVVSWEILPDGTICHVY